MRPRTSDMAADAAAAFAAAAAAATRTAATAAASRTATLHVCTAGQNQGSA